MPGTGTGCSFSSLFFFILLYFLYSCLSVPICAFWFAHLFQMPSLHSIHNQSNAKEFLLPKKWCINDRTPLLQTLNHSVSTTFQFQCPHELELLREENKKLQGIKEFQCPHGLELLQNGYPTSITLAKFQCPHGLELLQQECPIFLIFMILFMHTCYL